MSNLDLMQLDVGLGLGRIGGLYLPSIFEVEHLMNIYNYSHALMMHMQKPTYLSNLVF